MDRTASTTRFLKTRIRVYRFRLFRKQYKGKTLTNDRKDKRRRGKFGFAKFCPVIFVGFAE